jgi:5-formyltetrahydrofolate cyclo-ligase
MFGLGFDELILIAAVAAFFFDKKDIGNILRWFKTTRAKLANWQYELEDKIESLTQEAKNSIQIDLKPSAHIQNNAATIHSTSEISENTEAPLVADEKPAEIPSQNEIRTLIKTKLKQLDPSIKELQSAQLVSRLNQNTWIKDSATVAAFVSLPDEVQIISFLQKMCDENRILYLPKILENQQIQWIRIQSLDDLEQGAFGILEPKKSLINSQIPHPAIDLFIIPGMVFSEIGGRIGRGKGFYDRALAHYPHAKKLGVCYEFQIQESFIQQKHDIAMNGLITPKRWIPCAHN